MKNPPFPILLSSKNFKHGCWRTCFLYDSLKLPLSCPTLSLWDSMNILERNHHYWCWTTLINITLLIGEYISHTSCFPKNLKSMGLKTIPGSHCLHCTPSHTIWKENSWIPFSCMHSSKHHECIIYIIKLYKT